jgi:hypothetical protein
MASAILPRVADAADHGPPSQKVAFGSTGRVIPFGPYQTHKTIAAALLEAKPGDIVQYPDPEPRGQIFRESVGVPGGVTLDLGGLLVDGGTANPDWEAGAIIDGTGIPDPSGYVQKMGGVVALGDMMLKGAEITGFGMQETEANGTAGVRAAGNTVGDLYIDNCHIHHNQNGIGPGGASTTITVTNTWLHDNQLDPTGGCHNIYATSTVTSLVVGPGVTSRQTPLAKGGGGHAVKSRATNVTRLIGPAYLYSGDESCLDIPDGSAMPCPIGAGVTMVKKAGDPNQTVLGYCAESKSNGTAGVVCSGVTIIAGCPKPDILNNGPVSFDATCQFTGNRVVAKQPQLVTGLR